MKRTRHGTIKTLERSLSWNKHEANRVNREKQMGVFKIESENESLPLYIFIIIYI